MNRLNRIAATAALLSFASVAIAANEKEKSKDDGMICTMESVVGSHFPKRVCTTTTQRDDSRHNSQDRFRKVQDFNNRGMSPGAASSR